MVLTDVLYDVVSGVLGTLFGVVVTMLATRRRSRQMNELLTSNRAKLDSMAQENDRLLAALRDKENRILELERQILTQKSPSKKRGK